MSILYRPVKIETAEQAEALPEGTIAYKHHSDTSPSILPSEPPTSWVARSTAAKAATNWWLTGGHSRPDVDMIGWTALVAVEVEEVASEDYRTFHLIEAMRFDQPTTAYLPASS